MRLGRQHFVGREDELGVLLSALEMAMSGRAQWALIAGEAGIGKTSLADVLAQRSQERDVDVLWAVCSEGDGAPAYWPWIQLLRALIERRGVVVLSSLGPRVSAMASLLPDVVTTGSAVSLEPDEQRFALFDTLTVLFQRAAESRPLLLVIDDLHAADGPSLRLLDFVVRHMRDARTLVIATARDTRVGPAAVHVDKLAELGQTLALQGLASHDVARFMESVSGVAPADTLVESVQRKTGGNPLYVDEIVRTLLRQERFSHDDPLKGMSLPPRLSGAIQQRLETLSKTCRRFLEVGAVIGESFELSMLAGVLATSTDESVELAAEACRLKVIEAESVGRYRFAHRLLRDGLLELLPPAERMRLHRMVADALEARGAGADERMHELAYHYFEAIPLGTGDKAVHYALQSGHAALRQLAWETAASSFERALHALSAIGERASSRRAGVLLALGQVLHGEGDKAREAFREACEMARQFECWDLFAEAALGFAGEWMPVLGRFDDAASRLLEEAANALEGQESSLLARVLARLAMNRLVAPTCDAQPLAKQAVSVARACGEPKAIALALNAQMVSSWRLEHGDERLAGGAELVERGRLSGSPDLTARGHLWRVWASMERGDVATADLEIAAQARLAEETRLVWPQWMHESWRGMRALLRGRLQEADDWIERARMTGERAGFADALMAHAVQQYFLRRERGDLREMEWLIQSGQRHPEFIIHRTRAWFAYFYIDLGLVDEAAQQLAWSASDFDHLPQDLSFSSTLACVGQVFAYVGERNNAETMYGVLAPYEAFHGINANAWTYIDPLSRVLGLIATRLERWDDAQRHFERAIHQLSNMGAAPRLARTQCDYALMLRARDRSGDRQRALELFERAAETAHALGLAPLSAELERALSNEPRPRKSPKQSACFQRHGEIWTIKFRGHELRLKDSKGLRYLDTLLHHPYTDFHALALAAEAADSGGVLHTSDGGPILDRKALAAYRARLETLGDELAEAERHADLGRSEQLRNEIEQLTAGLESAVSPLGAVRRWDSPAERARLSVTKAIRSSEQKIASACPELGQHLANCIKTGQVCSYQPERDHEIVWQR